MPDNLDFEGRLRSILKDRVKKAALLEPPNGPEPLAIPETTQGSEGEKSRPENLVAINIFQHPESHPVVLDLLMLRRYGPEWMAWESELIREKIPIDFPTKTLSDLNMEKLQALRVLHFNDTFWQRWENFTPIVQVFNNQFPDFETHQIPTTAFIAVAVDTAKKIRDDVEWSDEVLDYIRTACRYDGVFCPPEPLDFVQIETVHGLVDKEEIQSLWPEVRRSGKAPTKIGITEEQLRRNLILHQYVKEFRDRLSRQLSLVSYG